MMKKIVKIKKGDNMINISINLKLSEWKPIVNLLNETDPSMVGYHISSNKIMEQVKLYFRQKSILESNPQKFKITEIDYSIDWDDDLEIDDEEFREDILSEMSKYEVYKTNDNSYVLLDGLSYWEESVSFEDLEEQIYLIIEQLYDKEYNLKKGKFQFQTLCDLSFELINS